MQYKGCLAHLTFADISLYLDETKQSAEGPAFIVIIVRGKVLLARRILCPMLADTDPKTWLVERFRRVMASQFDCGHCERCSLPILEIHTHLAEWLPPEKHVEFINGIEQCGPNGLSLYPFKNPAGDPAFPWENWGSPGSTVLH
jgi:uncharacterized protein with PIN domain